MLIMKYMPRDQKQKKQEEICFELQVARPKPKPKDKTPESFVELTSNSAESQLGNFEPRFLSEDPKTKTTIFFKSLLENPKTDEKQFCSLEQVEKEFKEFNQLFKSQINIQLDQNYNKMQSNPRSIQPFSPFFWFIIISFELFQAVFFIKEVAFTDSINQQLSFANSSSVVSVSISFENICSILAILFIEKDILIGVKFEKEHQDRETRNE